MDALAIFRLVATEFADMPDDDIVDADTGKVTKYGVDSFRETLWKVISESTGISDRSQAEDEWLWEQ